MTWDLWDDFDELFPEDWSCLPLLLLPPELEVERAFFEEEFLKNETGVI